MSNDHTGSDGTGSVSRPRSSRSRRPCGVPAGSRLSRLRRRSRCRSTDCSKGLTEGGQARVVELANAAGVTPPTATRILDALERRGIVERRRAPEDRRGVTITLTPNGRELLDTQHEWLRSRQEAFYAELPAGERAVAADLLVRLAALIDELAPGPIACE